MERISEDRLDQLLKFATAMVEADKANVYPLIVTALPVEVLQVLTELKESRAPKTDA